MPTSLTFAQSPSLSTEQRQGDTIQVSINRSASPLGTSENYYGDNPTKTDAPNTVTRDRMNKGMITNVQNHHLAFGGGSETANYRASITCRRACA